jgi:hypothetical protein
MKRLVTALAMIMTVGVSAAFATDDVKVDKDVLSAFQKDFTGAQHVKWSKEQNFYKAAFVLGDTRVIAYYSEEAEFAGSARSLVPAQLPLAVTSQISKRYGPVDLVEVTEISNDTGTSYKIMLETADKTIKLNAFPTGQLVLVKKIRK